MCAGAGRGGGGSGGVGVRTFRGARAAAGSGAHGLGAGDGGGSEQATPQERARSCNVPGPAGGIQGPTHKQKLMNKLTLPALAVYLTLALTRSLHRNLRACVCVCVGCPIPLKCEHMVA